MNLENFEHLPNFQDYEKARRPREIAEIRDQGIFTKLVYVTGVDISGEPQLIWGRLLNPRGTVVALDRTRLVALRKYEVLKTLVKNESGVDYTVYQLKPGQLTGNQQNQTIV